jgi:hypothetical protein
MESLSWSHLPVKRNAILMASLNIFFVSIERRTREDRSWTRTYQSPLLPGFDLPLKQLLKLADDWAAANQKRKRDKNREQPN